MATTAVDGQQPMHQDGSSTRPRRRGAVAEGPTLAETTVDGEEEAAGDSAEVTEVQEGTTGTLRRKYDALALSVLYTAAFVFPRSPADIVSFLISPSVPSLLFSDHQLLEMHDPSRQRRVRVHD